jgi:hypothetical protein
MEIDSRLLRYSLAVVAELNFNRATERIHGPSHRQVGVIVLRGYWCDEPRPSAYSS